MSTNVRRNNEIFNYINKSIGLRKEYGTWKCDRKNKYEEALEFLVETETVEDEETK